MSNSAKLLRKKEKKERTEFGVSNERLRLGMPVEVSSGKNRGLSLPTAAATIPTATVLVLVSGDMSYLLKPNQRPRSEMHLILFLLAFGTHLIFYFTDFFLPRLKNLPFEPYIFHYERIIIFSVKGRFSGMLMTNKFFKKRF